jgi:hypothetical protein
MDVLHEDFVDERPVVPTAHVFHERSSVRVYDDQQIADIAEAELTRTACNRGTAAVAVALTEA